MYLDSIFTEILLSLQLITCLLIIFVILYNFSEVIKHEQKKNENGKRQKGLPPDRY